MILTIVSKCLDALLGAILVERLFRLRLLSTYSVFAAFLLYDTFTSLALAALPWHWLFEKYGVDYRVVWLCLRPFAWIFYIAVVYGVLRRIMSEHAGILRLSRKVLTAIFVLAALFAAFTGIAELDASSNRYVSAFALIVSNALVMERTVLTTSWLSLAAMLLFLLWFPVSISRNIALICAGLLLYLSSDVLSILGRWIWSSDLGLQNANFALLAVHFACVLAWVLYLNKQGEEHKVRIGHVWKPQEQEKLLSQLQFMNAQLVQNAKR